MREMLQGKSFRTLIVVAVVLIVIMLYSTALGGNQNIFSAAFSFISTPVQRLSAKLTGSSKELSKTFADPVALSEENEALKDKIRSLTSSLVDYEEMKQENETLKQILGLKEENEDFEFVTANVISRDTSDSYQPFSIDAGKADGVALYDPIMTADGLVGYVSEVGPVSSKVTTILSPTINVGAFDRRTRDSGVIGGSSSLAVDGATKFGLLQRDCDVSTGDIVVTSGLGGIFPANVVIGEVTDIKPEPQSISLYAVITPAADILECREVFVLVDFKGQGAVVDSELVNGNASASAE